MTVRGHFLYLHLVKLRASVCTDSVCPNMCCPSLPKNRATMATFMGNMPGKIFPNIPLILLLWIWINWGVWWLRLEVFTMWKGERGPTVNGGDQFKTCVRHAGSFLALTSVSTPWDWWGIYRACGVGEEKLKDTCVAHARGGTSVLLTCPMFMVAH